jgi:hypothetical protein
MMIIIQYFRNSFFQIVHARTEKWNSVLKTMADIRGLHSSLFGRLSMMNWCRRRRRRSTNDFFFVVLFFTTSLLAVSSASRKRFLSPVEGKNVKLRFCIFLFKICFTNDLYFSYMVNPVVNFTNILHASFAYKSFMRNFFVLTF